MSWNIIPVWKYTRKGIWSTCCLWSNFAVCHMLYVSSVHLFQNKELLEMFPFLSNNFQKTSNMRTRTGILNLLYYLFSNSVKRTLSDFANLTNLKSFSLAFFEILIVMRCAIWYHLYNLKNAENTQGGVSLLVKVTLLHECLSRFLICTNGTKSRNVSHISIWLINHQTCELTHLWLIKQLLVTPSR